MTVNLLKKIPIALAALAFASANAAMDMDSRVTQLEHQMAQVRTDNSMGTYGANSASASPDTKGSDWFIAIGVLYEQARVAGSEYAYSDNDSNSGSIPLRGEIKEVRPDWDFGVNVALGMGTGHDGWEVAADFTHLSTSGNSVMNAGLNGGVIALRGTPNLVTQNGVPFTSCTQAKASIDFDYNSLSLLTARDTFFSKAFSLRPYAGLTSQWLKIKENVNYSGGTILGVNTIEVRDTNKYWGLGPVGGLKGRLHLGAGFSIFGDFNATLLYGNFDVTHKEQYTPDTGRYNINLTADFHRFVPELQMGLGLAYDTYLDEDKHHICVSLGYDARYLFRVNQMVKMDDNATYRYDRYSEDASMQGVVLEARWDF